MYADIFRYENKKGRSIRIRIETGTHGEEEDVLEHKKGRSIRIRIETWHTLYLNKRNDSNKKGRSIRIRIETKVMRLMISSLTLIKKEDPLE